MALLRFHPELETLGSTFSLLAGAPAASAPSEHVESPDETGPAPAWNESVHELLDAVSYPGPVLDPALRTEYRQLFRTCTIRPERLATVRAMVNKIRANQARCAAVAQKTEVPWYLIAVLQAMEANLNFNRHLHNGDPLTARTVHVPKGRPPHGNPPFTWEESALDALQYEGFTAWHDWTLPGILYKLEGYNGWGYRKYHPDVLTPYLWSFSTHYTRGKYVSDGTWSATAVSQQCGAAVLLKEMVQEQVIQIPETDG